MCVERHTLPFVAQNQWQNLFRINLFRINLLPRLLLSITCPSLANSPNHWLACRSLLKQPRSLILIPNPLMIPLFSPSCSSLNPQPQISYANLYDTVHLPATYTIDTSTVASNEKPCTCPVPCYSPCHRAQPQPPPTNKTHSENVTTDAHRQKLSPPQIYIIYKNPTHHRPPRSVHVQHRLEIDYTTLSITRTA